MTGAPVVSARGLVLDRGGRRILDGLDLDVRAGEVTGLIGPNGCGKTSLLLAAGGLIRYQGGSLLVSGREAQAHPYATRRAARFAFGVEPMNRALTGEAYIAFLRAHREASFRPADHDALVDGFAMTVAMRRRVGGYSLGMGMKLSLVAALSFDADAYLLDEAMNGLDHAALRFAAGFLRDRAAEGAAIVIASHVASVLFRLCDEVALLRGGKIAATLPGERRSGGEAALLAALDEAEF